MLQDGLELTPGPLVLNSPIENGTALPTTNLRIDRVSFLTVDQGPIRRFTPTSTRLVVRVSRSEPSTGNCEIRYCPFVNNYRELGRILPLFYATYYLSRTEFATVECNRKNSSKESLQLPTS